MLENVNIQKEWNGFLYYEKKTDSKCIEVLNIIFKL